MKQALDKERPIRYGILGCGMIAAYHAKAICETGGVILGAASRSFAGAERFASQWNATAYPSYADMLNNPQIDVIVICTPSGLHAAQTVQALLAEKHVIVEKPMCVTLAEADEVIRTAEATGKLVTPISQMRFADGIRAAKRAVDEGRLGQMSCASLSMQYHRSDAYYAQAAWRGTWALDGGGCLMNQGIHGVDAFRYIVGPVEELDAYIATRAHSIEVEDCAAAVLRLANGAVATLDASTASAPGYARRIQLCGSRGSIVLEDRNVIRWDIPEPCPVPMGGDLVHAATADPRALSGNVHTEQYKNFLHALQGTEEPVLGAREGREALEIILAVYQSAQTGRRVRISPYRS